MSNDRHSSNIEQFYLVCDNKCLLIEDLRTCGQPSLKSFFLKPKPSHNEHRKKPVGFPSSIQCSAKSSFLFLTLSSVINFKILVYVVLCTIVPLFYWGQRQVYQSKTNWLYLPMVCGDRVELDSLFCFCFWLRAVVCVVLGYAGDSEAVYTVANSSLMFKFLMLSHSVFRACCHS